MKTEIKKESLILVGANELAQMLSVSPRHIWRMKAASKLPKSINFGRCVCWVLSDIRLFIQMGCPSQKEFEARNEAGIAQKAEAAVITTTTPEANIINNSIKHTTESTGKLEEKLAEEIAGLKGVKCR